MPNLCFRILLIYRSRSAFRCVQATKHLHTDFHTQGGRGQCGIHKKCAGTRYIELVFLRLVGSLGHVVHSGAILLSFYFLIFFLSLTYMQIRSNAL
jgi:hypothetical protein